ncbi:hypothetical protein [Virgibacillus dakarensis]|uniref:hypothetical protein n=1 Tax=Virgibacillus dakarensis TaxID=1917889 RepID=UPI000B43D25C|nr:hypothetical protein [Virgibacillus dakarensis]
MNDYRSLKFLDLFQSIFRSINIDYDVMRKILQIKLTMDQRRVPTIFANSTSKKKDSNQFLKSLGIYALYGLALIPFLFLGENYMFQSSIMFGITMFILMTSMISDFSSVLLDVRDKTILHTKPLNTRTVNAAKIIHVTIYMTMLTGAFIAIPAIVMLFVKGFAYFLVFFVEIILLVLFIMALTAMVYIFVLRFFSGERLKDIINYVQILLSVGIVVGYQIVIRAFDFVDLNFTYDFSWWHVFIPPIWFAAPFELLLNQNYTSVMIILSLLTLIVPIVSIIVYYRLMPTFERNLQKLMEDTAKTKKSRWNFRNLWERLLCSSKEERLFFRFSQIMMGREREFKLKVYPSLGMALVFPFIFVFNALNTGSFSELATSRVYLNIYFCNIIIGIVVHMLKFSGKYKGAWVFQVTPIKKTERFYSATLKAFLVKLYVPVYLILCVAFIAIFSFRILPDLMIVFVTAVLNTLIAYKVINNEEFPFTQAFESAQEGANSIKYFLLMFLVALFAGLHFLATIIPFGVYLYLAILLVVTFVAWRIVFSKREAMV